MTYHSRGIARHARNGSRPPPPLTDMQRNIIEAWARRGRRDREIAEFLEIPECRVEGYRTKLGIKGAGNKGMHLEVYQAKMLRPAHVTGEHGSDEWWRTNEIGFQSAVIAAGRW